MRNLSIVALLLLAGCEPALFTAKIDAPLVCVSGMRVTFPQASIEGTSQEPLSASDLGTEVLDSFDFEVEVKEATLRPIGAMEDLDFVDSVGVKIAPVDPDSGLEPLDVLRLEHAADEPSALYDRPTTPIDVTDYVTATAEGVIFSFALDVAEPAAVAWEAEMDLCVHTSAGYTKSL
jgi:hypothetical protein